LRFIARDPILTGILKVSKLPVQSTFWRFVNAMHPDGTGALKKTAHKPLANHAADGTPKYIWLPRLFRSKV
jgi:hypothetical protein